MVTMSCVPACVTGQIGKRRLRCTTTITMLALAVLLGGCANLQGGGGSQSLAGPSSSDSLNDSRGDKKPDRPNERRATSAFTPLGPRPDPRIRLNPGRVPIQALFAKRTVSGDELVSYLLDVRRGALDRKSDSAAVRLMGGIQRATDGKAANVNWQDEALKFATGVMATAAIGYAQDALDPFIQQLMDDQNGLRSESITLPDPRGLNEAQRKRAVTMAAMVVTARAAGKVLNKADKDFNTLEQDYSRLMERREKLAGILAEAVGRRQQAIAARDDLAARKIDAQLALPYDDIQFIERFKGQHSLKEFSSDFAMQNYALAYIRKSDPSAYKDYRGEADGWVGRTKAYVRSVSGVAALGGVMAGFVGEVATLYRGRKGNNGAADIIAALPFGVDFALASAPLISKATVVAAKGVVIEPMVIISPKRFRVETNGKEDDFRSASGVFEALKGNGADQLLVESLFRHGAPGLLYSMYQCDPSEVGRMLDLTVPNEERAQFANRSLGIPAHDLESGFSFITVLTEKGRRDDLAVRLLGRDQRQAAETVGIGQVQRMVSTNYTKWDDAQLTRLILSNRSGTAANASLMLGSTYVRLVPSMTAVYEYEVYSEGCRAAAFGATPPPAPAQGRFIKKK